ncbi:hypothetical protein GCM10027445_59270 [Amycolatopsis endophytica]|uniref:Uncharacterized protein n=1 Tax=Amycolatopsis endophytica TaxID=860233 RepID=A0A853AXU7_9PSEU|nr:hypothetical protein [Amycolatopsis endophytica]NYI87510.1 hypothetical protein [Amycolatopsis endophytica]
MRTWKPLLALGALALVLAGCSNEAGPTPKGGGGQADTPYALSIKLNALTADPCFREPAGSTPRGCGKYVTELGSTPGVVREQAGTKHPDLVALSGDLDKGIGAYRDNRCDTVAEPGDPCTAALTTIADSLRSIKHLVDTQLVAS